MFVLTYLKKFVGRLQDMFQLRLCHSLVRHRRYAANKAHQVVKQKSAFVVLLLAALTLASCEKVLNLDLDKVEKQYIIEAMISDQTGSCKVLITETRNFDENNTFTGISGADVTISDNNGAPQTLIETSAGVYEAPALKGVALHTYQLNVAVNGRRFTASSTMPAAVPFDSLYITERTFFDETNKYATVSYQDPAGVRNAYRFIQYVNGVKEKTIFVRDDDNNDGNKIERTLIYFTDDDVQDDKKLKIGDSVKVEMLSISYPIYKYWYSLTESATGENQSATPGNPLSNIQGGALGYFSAHTYQSKTIAVP